MRTSAYIWLNMHQDRATRSRPRLRRLITFARPRIGVSDFAEKFNAAIESCYRVVNFLDIVPCCRSCRRSTSVRKSASTAASKSSSAGGIALPPINRDCRPSSQRSRNEALPAPKLYTLQIPGASQRRHRALFRHRLPGRPRAIARRRAAAAEHRAAEQRPRPAGRRLSTEGQTAWRSSASTVSSASGQGPP